MSSTSTPLHSQEVDPPQDFGFEQAGYGAAPSFGPFDRRSMDGCSSAVSKARKRSTPTCTRTVDDVPDRNSHHPTSHTRPHDQWIAHYRASNHAAYPELSFLSAPATNLSLHHAMRHSLGYSQSDENVPTFGELPFGHQASAGPATGLVSTLPFRDHPSLQLGGRAEDHEGTSRSDRVSGQAIDSEVSWSSPPSPVIPAPQEQYPQDYSGGENIQTSTDLSIFRSFCVEATMSTTAAHVFYGSATGMTSGCVDDHGMMDPVSDPSIDSRDGCSSAAFKARKWPTPTYTGTVDDAPVRNNHHPPIHTPPHDQRIASNHAACPDLSFLSPPVTNISLHHAMRHSLGYSQGKSVPTFGELPLVHNASSAKPATGLVSTLPFRGHASFQFDDGWAEDDEGTSWSDRVSGQAIDSKVSWSSPSNPVIPTPQERYLPDYSGGENIQTFTDLSIFRSFCVETTMNTAAAHIFQGSATGMTSGCVDGYGITDSVSDPGINSNLPPPSISDVAPSPYEPHTFERLSHTGGGSFAKPPGPPVADRPYEKTTDVRQLRDRTIACGWINPDGMVCNKPIDYRCGIHFATKHGITKLSSDVKVECCWCPVSRRKEVKRKGFIRHIRERHMKYQRPKKKRHVHLGERNYQ